MFTLSTTPEERSYHHGDLRRALVSLALKILSEDGVAGLSLRAVARRAKVSAMAPYRHFADKEALLAAVAEHGFRQLTIRFSAAAAAAPDPRAALNALGVAYVVFACDEPSLFKLMFGPAIEQKPTYPGLNEAGCACFDALRQAVKAAKFFEGDRPLKDVSLACWSLVHGLASLIVDGRLAEEDAGTAEAVATRLTQLLSDSLAALGKVPIEGAPLYRTDGLDSQMSPIRST